VRSPPRVRTCSPDSATPSSEVSAPVFLVDAERLRASERIVLDGEEGRHAAVVRRIGLGESVELTDGAGHVARSVVVDADRVGLVCQVRERIDVPQPAPRLVVAQALAKGNRGELAVETLTEVGVDEIVPWSAQRCVVRWDGERGVRALQRWRSTAREAGKQSRRAWLPVVTEPATTRQLAERMTTATLTIVLHEEATTSLMAIDLPEQGDVMLVVGPEGGIAPDELDVFASSGAQTAILGPNVLRTSTAGTVAAGVLLLRTVRWATRR
jgi:16S rRNA (uracil1498-N3)-methyltransferase